MEPHVKYAMTNGSPNTYAENYPDEYNNKNNPATLKAQECNFESVELELRAEEEDEDSPKRAEVDVPPEKSEIDWRSGQLNNEAHLVKVKRVMIAPISLLGIHAHRQAERLTLHGANETLAAKTYVTKCVWILLMAFAVVVVVVGNFRNCREWLNSPILTSETIISTNASGILFFKLYIYK